jgi:putative transposase
MKRKRHSEEEIIGILRGAEKTDKTIVQYCREVGVTEQTYYKWKRTYDGLDVEMLKELKALQKENNQLKAIVADQALDIQALKLINSKKW